MLGYGHSFNHTDFLTGPCTGFNVAWAYMLKEFFSTWNYTVMKMLYMHVSETFERVVSWLVARGCAHSKIILGLQFTPCSVVKSNGVVKQMKDSVQ